MSELFSLVRFLRVDPYSYYFDKTGQCKSLNWDMGPSGKHCEHCGKHRINHFCWWNKHIMNPIVRHGYSGPGRTAMLRLKHEVLVYVCVRERVCVCVRVCVLVCVGVCLRVSVA